MMAEPKSEPHQIPSGHQVEETKNKMMGPSEPESRTEATDPSPDSQEGKKITAIKKYTGQAWAGLRKIPPIPYLRTLHGEDKHAFWIALFTLALVWFTYQLVVVTNKVDETTRDTQRAFLAQKGVDGTNEITPDGKLVDEIFLVRWENSGNTPIRHGMVHAEPHKRTDNLPPDYDFRDTDSQITQMSLGARGITSTTVVVPAADIDLARQGKARLFIWGWASYRDLFFPKTPEHLHEFCVEIKFTRTKVIPDPLNVTWVTTSCGQHDCDDEDCTDYQTHFK